MLAAATGEIDVALGTEASARPLVQAGKLRVLATMGGQHSPFFRDAPTFKEAGWPALVQEEWFGAFMPPRTSSAIVQSASDAMAAALREPDVRDVWEKTGLLIQSSTPAQLQEATQREFEFWRRAVAEFRFTPEA